MKIIAGAVIAVMGLALSACSDDAPYKGKFADKGLQACVADTLRKEGLTDPGEITELLCQDEDVQSLAGLDALQNLEELYLQDNTLTSLQGMGELPRLRIISVAGNRQLKSLQGLEGARALEEFQANKCSQLSDIAALGHLPDLKIVAAMMAQVSDISALSSLQRLEDVTFNYNKIRNIDALADKPALRKVMLYSNPLGDISPLLGNPALEAVGIGGDNLTHCSVIEQLTSDLGPDAIIYGPERCAG